VTKHQGIVRAEDYFKKAVHGRDTSNYKVVAQGQFAYATIHLDEGSIGYLDSEAAGMVSPMYTVFQPADGVDPRYLLAVLKRPQSLGTYRTLAQGTVNRRASIAFDALASLHLLCPPLAEQRKIATILLSVDEAIEKTQAVIDQVQVVKKGLMQELLTRGLPGRHKKFKKTEIGEIPEEWEVCPLEQVAVVQTGIAKGKTVERGIELPYLRVANVQDGHVDLSEMKTIIVASAMVDRYRLRAGDVLFTEGGDADKLGRGCVWRGQLEPCLHQNHVFAVRPLDGRLLSDFLAHWAASSRGKAYFMDCAKQTTNLASINSTQLKALPVPMPSPDEQHGIVVRIDSANARFVAEAGALQALQTIKSALMSVLLTGEVRVKRDPEVAA